MNNFFKKQRFLRLILREEPGDEIIKKIEQKSGSCEAGSCNCFQLHTQLWYNFIGNFVASERLFTTVEEAAGDADKRQAIKKFARRCFTVCGKGPS